MTLNQSRAKVLICGFIGFAFLAGLFGYHSFVNRKCTAYPWWYEQGNDGDGINVTQALTLVNNGDLTCVSQPAGTVYALHGALYRGLCVFSKPHCPLMQLDKVPGPAAAFDLLDAAMRASRVLTYFIYLTLLVVFWMLLSRLSNSRCMGFFGAAFFMATPMMLEKLHIIRSELISFTFVAAMLAMVLYYREKKSLPAEMLWGGIIGVLAGLAIFAKILVLPEVFGVIVLWLFWQSGLRGPAESRRISAFAVLAAVFNFLIMPWHWLRRPDLLTDAYLKTFYPGGDEIRVYGPVPATLAPLFAVILGTALVAAALALFRRKIQPQLARVAFRINCAATGMVFSCYFIFFPLGMNYHSYAAASNHLLYATMTNVLYGAFLQHKVTWDTLQYSIGLHAGSQLFGMSILRYVTAAALGSLLRISLRTTPDKRPYYGVLVFFAAGFFMDIISSMRWVGNHILSSYGIYSLSCHVLGLGLWLGTECGRLGRLGRAARIMICALLAIHLISRAVFFINHFKASGQVVDQTPEQEIRNTLSHVRPFWSIVSRGQL
ncbi:MAG: hypothetical protein HY591_01905 [Candidatus Omnitrophica bacterium]|nr:hypothetical protein [Candidatus Omnitrophota bacterium]